MRTGLLHKVYIRARLPATILIDKLFKRIAPRVAVLVVNNACNLRCKYCFGQYHGRSSKDDFSTNGLKAIIDDLHANGTIYMTIHGGETLLRKDIGEIVRYIKSKGIYLNLITNGVLLRNKMDEIRGVDSICISVDGREENNDSIRGKGSFKAAMDAVEVVKAEGIPLRVQSTLSKYTRGDIAYLAALAREKRFSLEFSLLYQSTLDIQDLIMDDGEIRNVLREIIDLKKRGYPVFTSFRTLDLALQWPFHYDHTSLTREELSKKLKPIPCSFSRHKIHIDADGRVFPCFSTMYAFNGLNVRNVSVKKAFRHLYENNSCVLCPHLTNNDWNFMMTLSPGFLYQQVRLHLKELLNG